MTNTQALIAQYGFACVALVIFAGEIGLPIFVPGEIALLLAGSQLVHSTGQLAAACLFFGMLDLVATTSLHVMARSGGNRLLRYGMRRVLRDGRTPESVLARWRARLGGHDALVIFLLRFVPVCRMYASLISGLLRIRLRHFVIGAAPAAFLWAAIPLIVGYAMRDNIAAVEAHYTTMLHGVFVALGAVLVMALIRWRLAARRASAMRGGKRDRPAA